MSIRETALAAAMTETQTAEKKAHQLNYETLYVGTDGTVHWSESIRTSEREYYRDRSGIDRSGIFFVEELLQVGTGSCHCNCDYCNMIGKPQGYDVMEDAIADAVMNADLGHYEEAIATRLNADINYDSRTGLSGIPYGYFDDEEKGEN